MLKKCLITCALSVFSLTTLQVLEASSPTHQKELNCEEQHQQSSLACGKCGNKDHISEDALALCGKKRRKAKENDHSIIEELQSDSTLAGCGCRKKQKPKQNGLSLNEQVSDDSLLACRRGKRGKRHRFPRALVCNQSEEQGLNNQDTNHQEFMLACGNCK